MIPDSLTDKPLESDETHKSVLWTGANLALFLGLPLSLKVLIVGTGLKKWINEFSGAAYLERCSNEIAYPREIDLILFNCGDVIQTKDLVICLEKFLALLTPTGRLMLFAPNAFSFFSEKRFLSFFQNAWIGRTSSRNGYRKALSMAGFGTVREFIAMPRLNSVEEIVSLGSRFIELPHYWHPLLHLAQRFGFFTFLTDGFVYIAGRGLLDNAHLLLAVNDLVGEATGQTDVQCIVERVDLRMRGSMVLFVFAPRANRHFIVRIVTNTEIRQLVSRNELFLQILHINQDLPERLKDLLPKPLGNRMVSGGIIYVENLLAGVLAWKVNRESLGKLIYEESTRFIFQFQYYTRRKILLGKTELKDLINDDLERIETFSNFNPPLLLEIKSLVKRICKVLYDRELFLVASHGDYSYGNILVNPLTGQLKGVIDWDTGRTLDLPGIDLLTLEVQKLRTETGCSLSDAFEKVFVLVMERGDLDLDGEYRRHLNIVAEVLPTILMLTFIRFIIRAMRYPNLFNTQQVEYIKAIGILNSKIFKRY